MDGGEIQKSHLFKKNMVENIWYLPLGIESETRASESGAAFFCTAQVREPRPAPRRFDEGSPSFFGANFLTPFLVGLPTRSPSSALLPTYYYIYIYIYLGGRVPLLN